MKKNNLYKMLLLAGGLTFSLAACEDEVLVETKDNTKVNELLAAITAADQQYATLNVENNTLTVSNEAAEKAIAELDKLKQELLNPSSKPTEIHYTVTVLSSSNAVLSGAGGVASRTKGYEGATVVVEQNGLVLQPSSTSNGLYLFKGLKEGYIYVRVSAPDHASVEYRAYIYMNDGQDVESAESFNAQTQIVLYPVSGSKAAKFTGKAYANTSVLNDTLNRKYGSGAAFGTKANTYISVPTYNFYDYTYSSDGASSFFNVYGKQVTGNNYVAQNENALAGHKVYAYPYVDQFANNDYWSNNGKVIEVIYKGLVTSATIGADGSYTLPVVSSTQYNDDQSAFVYGIQISSETYIAPHTRLTTWGGNYYGQTNETGSTQVDIKYFNNTNSAILVHNGTGTTTVSINPATSAVVKRRVITENWRYFMYVDDDYVSDVPLAGETRTVNLYFHPRYRSED